MSPMDIEVLAYEESPIGMICLRQRALRSEPGAVVTEITLDHEFLMSSCNTASERALAHHALDMHPGKELAVLVKIADSADTDDTITLEDDGGVF